MPPKLAKAPFIYDKLQAELKHVREYCIFGLNDAIEHPLPETIVSRLLNEYQDSFSKTKKPLTDIDTHISLINKSNQLLDILVLSGYRSPYIINFGDYIFKILIQTIRSYTEKFGYSERYTALPQKSKTIKRYPKEKGQLGIDFHQLSGGFVFFYLYNIPNTHRLLISAGFGINTDDENKIQGMNILRYGVRCALQYLYPLPRVQAIEGTIALLKNNANAIIFGDKVKMYSEEQLIRLASCNDIDTTTQLPILESTTPEIVTTDELKPANEEIDAKISSEEIIILSAAGQANGIGVVATLATEEPVTASSDSLETAQSNDLIYAKAATGGSTKAAIDATKKAKQFLLPSSMSHASTDNVDDSIKKGAPELHSSAVACPSTLFYTPKKSSAAAKSLLGSPDSVITAFN